MCPQTEYVKALAQVLKKEKKLAAVEHAAPAHKPKPKKKAGPAQPQTRGPARYVYLTQAIHEVGCMQGGHFSLGRDCGAACLVGTSCITGICLLQCSGGVVAVGCKRDIEIVPLAARDNRLGISSKPKQDDETAGKVRSSCTSPANQVFVSRGCRSDYLHLIRTLVLLFAGETPYSVPLHTVKCWPVSFPVFPAG